jgi:alkaline phosphatase D
VIAADMPISLVIVYDDARKWGIEGVAQGDDGAPRGPELEIADLLSFIKHAGVRNTVWLTADVHSTAGRSRMLTIGRCGQKSSIRCSASD